MTDEKDDMETAKSLAYKRIYAKSAGNGHYKGHYHFNAANISDIKDALGKEREHLMAKALEELIAEGKIRDQIEPAGEGTEFEYYVPEKPNERNRFPQVMNEHGVHAIMAAYESRRRKEEQKH